MARHERVTTRRRVIFPGMPPGWIGLQRALGRLGPLISLICRVVPSEFEDVISRVKEQISLIEVMEQPQQLDLCNVCGGHCTFSAPPQHHPESMFCRSRVFPGHTGADKQTIPPRSTSGGYQILLRVPKRPRGSSITIGFCSASLH